MNKYIYMKQGTLQLPVSRFPPDLDLLNMNGKTSKKSPTKCRRCAMAKPINRSLLNKFQRLDIPSTSFEREMYTYHKNPRILPLSSWFQMNLCQSELCRTVSSFFPSQLRSKLQPSLLLHLNFNIHWNWEAFSRHFWNFEKATKTSPLDRDQNMISNFQVEVSKKLQGLVRYLNKLGWCESLTPSLPPRMGWKPHGLCPVSRLRFPNQNPWISWLDLGLNYYHSHS